MLKSGCDEIPNPSDLRDRMGLFQPYVGLKRELSNFYRKGSNLESSTHKYLRGMALFLRLQVSSTSTSCTPQVTSLRNACITLAAILPSPQSACRSSTQQSDEFEPTSSRAQPQSVQQIEHCQLRLPEIFFNIFGVHPYSNSLRWGR